MNKREKAIKTAMKFTHKDSRHYGSFVAITQNAIYSTDGTIICKIITEGIEEQVQTINKKGQSYSLNYPVHLVENHCSRPDEFYILEKDKLIDFINNLQEIRDKINAFKSKLPSETNNVYFIDDKIYSYKTDRFYKSPFHIFEKRRVDADKLLKILKLPYFKKGCAVSFTELVSKRGTKTPCIKIFTDEILTVLVNMRD